MLTCLLLASSFRWLLPIPPHPTRATVSVSGLPTAGAATAIAAAPAADDLRNVRRVVDMAAPGEGEPRPQGRRCGWKTPPALRPGFAGSRTELIQHVLRDADDGGVVAAKAVAPVGGSHGDDRPAASVRPDDRVARATLLPLLVPLAVVRVPPCGTSRQHHEVLRRSVSVGG